MTLQLNGATRLYPIMGDPIAQVKSPAGVSESLQAAGVNALVVPMHVQSADFAACMTMLQAIGNADGAIITVPHKFSAAVACATLSDRARFLGAVNTVRRNSDGTWHGDMFDGLGYVNALLKNGCDPRQRRALLIGAGGAGSAIAHALVEAGVGQLSIYDPDTTRSARLVQRLSGVRGAPSGQICLGKPDPRGFELVLNASPVGMDTGDSLPLDVHGLTRTMFVGDVITAPAVTPLLMAARALGCSTQTGADMFVAVRDLMLAFLLRQSD